MWTESYKGLVSRVVMRTFGCMYIRRIRIFVSFWKEVFKRGQCSNPHLHTTQRKGRPREHGTCTPINSLSLFRKPSADIKLSGLSYQIVGK